MDVADVAADLIAEQDSLDAICAGLSESDWSSPTASPGWTVADQIGHLAYFDDAAAIAITDEPGFASMKKELLGHLGSGSDPDAFTLGRYRTMSGPELLDAWRQDRRSLADASATLTNDRRVDWFGPSMGAKSFLTARLMEAWAHGQDVADTVGQVREPTDRLRHIAQLGFITRGWTYINRGLEAPTSELQVRLTAPSGDEWLFGPDQAPEDVAGSAEDFCLVVTQRRHLDDTQLQVSGEQAREWLLMAQAFAGGASDGPKPQSASA
jgi:uncharacterized protein (TIGR03084 family)